MFSLSPSNQAPKQSMRISICFWLCCPDFKLSIKRSFGCLAIFGYLMALLHEIHGVYTYCFNACERLNRSSRIASMWGSYNCQRNIRVGRITHLLVGKYRLKTQVQQAQFQVSFPMDKAVADSLLELPRIPDTLRLRYFAGSACEPGNSLNPYILL